MSEEIDELRRGGLRRMLVAVAIVAAIAVAVTWGLAARDRTEPELAHRVLILGGTPTDLIAVIDEAGFEATQITWQEAQTQCADERGEFDISTVIAHADEHGYGFVALMLGEDMLVPSTILGETAPNDARAAVIGIGDLAPEGPRVHFGAPPSEIDYAAGMRSSEALRMALYTHPDLLALWDDPSRDEVGQQVHLGDLEQARTLLENAMARYGHASMIMRHEPPIQREPMFVRGGRLVREVPLTLRVDRQRMVELVRGEARVQFESNRGESLPTTIDPRAKWLFASGGAVGLLDTDAEWQRWRFDGGAPIREGEADPTLEFPQLSSEGSLLGFRPGELHWSTSAGERGTLPLYAKFVPTSPWDDLRVVAGWLDDEIAVLAGLDVDGARWLGFLELGHADGPRLTSLPIDELRQGGNRQYPTIVAIHPSVLGLYLVIGELDEEFDPLERLVRLEFDPERLRASMIPVAGEPATLDWNAVTVASRSLAQLGENARAVDLGPVPGLAPDSLVVAPDGSWLAWRTSEGAVLAAAIVGDALATPVGHGPSLGNPQISPDSQTLLWTVEREVDECGSFIETREAGRPSP